MIEAKRERHSGRIELPSVLYGAIDYLPDLRRKFLRDVFGQVREFAQRWNSAILSKCLRALLIAFSGVFPWPECISSPGEEKTAE